MPSSPEYDPSGWFVPSGSGVASAHVATAGPHTGSRRDPRFAAERRTPRRPRDDHRDRDHHPRAGGAGARRHPPPLHQGPRQGPIDPHPVVPPRGRGHARTAPTELMIATPAFLFLIINTAGHTR